MAGIGFALRKLARRDDLLGSLQGPDLLATWLLLHRCGADRPRIARCL